MKRSRPLKTIVVLSLLLTGCIASRKTTNTLSHFFGKEAIFADHFTGFALYDPERGKSIYQYQAGKFFTPASNTKIISLFAALSYLRDSLPAIKYQLDQERLYVWGMADPTTLHPAFDRQDHVFTFINNQDLPVTFCTNHFNSGRFGPGWAWDDYPYNYQAEKSYFPVFGNLLWIQQQPNTGSIIFYPNIFKPNISNSGSSAAVRAEYKNQFELTLPANQTADFQMPFFLGDSVLPLIFQKMLKNEFEISKSCPTNQGLKIFYSIKTDTVYHYMMQQSDNFLAEQLLLSAAGVITDSLSTENLIAKIKKEELPDIADELQWYDGSGLSRYNMVTPRAMVRLLDKIRLMIGDDRIKKMFPAGGESGTIKNWYANKNASPYVYAKTGTLKGVHCLSGYIYTDQGNTFIFSFMHNNFIGSSNPIKEKMNRVLWYIKSNF